MRLSLDQRHYLISKHLGVIAEVQPSSSTCSRQLSVLGVKERAHSLGLWDSPSEPPTALCLSLGLNLGLSVSKSNSP